MATQDIYTYLETFTIDQSFFSTISLDFSKLNLCQITIISEVFSKSITRHHNIQTIKQIITSNSQYLHSKHLCWFSILSILLNISLSQQQFITNLYMNKQNKEKIKYLVTSNVSLFDKQYVDQLVSALQIALQQQTITITINQIYVSLFTFENHIENLNKQYAEDIVMEKERIILNYVKGFYKEYDKNVCEMFLEFLLKEIDAGLLKYVRQWLKIQLVKEEVFPIDALEFICKCVIMYQEKNKIELFTKKQIFEIPMLYHLFSFYILKSKNLKYPYFQSFMFKYSLISKLSPILSSSTFIPLSSHPPSSSLQPFQPTLSSLFLNPFLSSKHFLHHFLSLSQIKLKKPTLDPLCYLLIKNQYYLTQQTLPISLWFSLWQWKTLLPLQNPKTKQYTTCLNKIIQQFLKNIPIVSETTSYILKQYK